MDRQISMEEREESFRSTSECSSSFCHPLDYYEAHDGRRCMEWEEFDSHPGTESESDSTSQISSSSSIAASDITLVGRGSLLGKGFEELLGLREKVLSWLMFAKKTRTVHTDQIKEANSWLLRVDKVINLKRRDDVLSNMLPWRKGRRDGLEHLKKPLMKLKTITVPRILSISPDVPVRFSYEELAMSTDNFSPEKIVSSGYVNFDEYDAKLRGQRARVKQFKSKITKNFFRVEISPPGKKFPLNHMEIFLTELEVLTHVNHPNVVRLIGYCMEEGSLLLVYEYMENYDLIRHLHWKHTATGMPPFWYDRFQIGLDSAVALDHTATGVPLSWDSRVQIALDSAVALDHIHQQTPRVYIHCHINPSTILLDGSLRGKISGFDLTVIAESGVKPVNERMGKISFGYIAPEYIASGEVSTKVDVYAFGVLLYQLISAKGPEVYEKKKSAQEDIDIISVSRTLKFIFDDAFHDPDRVHELLLKLVDPRLQHYPIDAVCRMAVLARPCTQKDPHCRPTMREVVAELRLIAECAF